MNWNLFVKAPNRGNDDDDDNDKKKSKKDEGMHSIENPTNDKKKSNKNTSQQDTSSDEDEKKPSRRSSMITGDDYFKFQMLNENDLHPNNFALRKMQGGFFENGTDLVKYSIIDPNDPDRQKVQDMIINSIKNGKSEFPNLILDRGMACFLCMALGDALGAPFEFSPVCYGKIETEEMKSGGGGFGLQAGQWTDDASMGLCMADSLLLCNGFHPADMKLRFLNWWNFGYNNAFRETPRHSVGLGGNISQSFFEFMKKGTSYTKAGDKETSGNGSLMRLAAVPLFYHQNLENAQLYSRFSSLLTHQGEEAEECCAVLATIILAGLNGDGTVQTTLGKINYTSRLYSINALVNSQQEDPKDFPEKHKDWKVEDRNWNWKDPNYRYSPTRSRQQPGYIGSYAMDCLSMALHCVWSTKSLKEAMVKCANMCGDADTVCSVTGQIAGAIYGTSAIPLSWLYAVQKWDGKGDIALKAWKLLNKSQDHLRPEALKNAKESCNNNNSK